MSAKPALKKITVRKNLRILELLMTVVPIVLIAMVYWHLINFEPDHLIEVLGGIPVAFKLVSEIRSNKLEKFTTANVLAVGNVKNFATPLIDAMLTQQLISTERHLHLFCLIKYPILNRQK